jgi:hypothetical protein
MKKTYAPTPQQQFCIESADNVRVTKIIACAGGGKTSTLELIAKTQIKKSLYAAFNKVTAVEAADRFPDHVTCQTTHSMAYAAFGRQMNHKLARPRGGYVNVAGTGSEIAKYYKLEGVKNIVTANAIGMFVKKTVERFEQSAVMEIAAWHVPKNDMQAILETNPEVADYVLKAARAMWKDRINLNSKVLASHDTYLKLYQMSKPLLPFEIIYCDEFQDATPCVVDIILSQPETTKLITVGDPYQAIYGWRGAINALEVISGTEAPLSKSFRYGNDIAKVATAILGNKMIVTGRDDLPSVIGFNVVDRTKPYMYLFRTNAMLLLEAVAAIDRGEKVKVEIDVKDFVKVLESSQALFDGCMKDVKHERILPYPNWATMKEEAKEGGGGELGRLVSIVEGKQSAHIIRVLEDYSPPDDAIATYTSCHKAKGREHDQVILAEDFKSNYVKGEWKGLPQAEENLLYVAATRAMRVLQINNTVYEILEKFGIVFGDGVHPEIIKVIPEFKISEGKVERDFKAEVNKMINDLERDIPQFWGD